jgi:hypothetical protein
MEMPNITQDERLADILLAEYANRNDWQRHNEIQRAQLVAILLSISAALVALLRKTGRYSQPTGPFLRS